MSSTGNVGESLAHPPEGGKPRGRRHRRRRKTASRVVSPRFVWWHLALAIVVALVGVVLTIQVVSHQGHLSDPTEW